MRTGKLRQRILAFVVTLVMLSLFGSAISLYRITEVNRSLDGINRVSVPLGQLMVQLHSDGEVLRRELERRLSSVHWSEARWRPRPVPDWIADVIANEIKQAGELVGSERPWTSAEGRVRWRSWADGLERSFELVRRESTALYLALEQKDMSRASQLYPRWMESLDAWTRQVEWGRDEFENLLRQSFGSAEGQVSELRTGLKIILIAVVALSLLLLWLGERALRPLVRLTHLASEIASRGLRKGDKSQLPEISLSRNDEVSQLAREFHRMATVLLEREKTVETQKERLQEQNRLLREMGMLNQNILDSIHSVLIVTDTQGRITQHNPVAAEWLAAPSEKLIGSDLLSWPRVGAFSEAASAVGRIARGEADSFRIEPQKVDSGERVYGGQLMALRTEAGEPYGAILVLDDLTDEVDLQDRLRTAEKLAAVGRMSAQVAHEVRNPLHSIGLEAELAAEVLASGGLSSANPARGVSQLRQSLQSILCAVDRLDKITENYLKLSRLSSGQKEVFDLGQALENVMATYAPSCEAQGVRVDWSRPHGVELPVLADRDLVENALSNLLRNALQALEEDAQRAHPVDPKPWIGWTLGRAESGRIWLRVEDNGPGVSEEFRERLFSPFATSKAQGTGLGLSFAKKVIEDHGGTIQYLERPSGQRGACFELTLREYMLSEPMESAGRPRFEEAMNV